MSGKLEARVVVPTGDWQFELSHSTDGTNTVSLVAGKSYYHSSTGSEANDLAAELASKMSAFGTSYTVTPSLGDGGTGKYTLTASAGTFGITWTNTALRDLLGFDANFATQTTVTGADHAQGLWIPNGPVEKQYALTSLGKPRSSGSVQVASDGTYYAYHGPKTRRDRLRWIGVTDTKTIEAKEASANESFESFYLDAIRGEADWAVSGNSVRWYADADDDATFLTYHVLNATEPEVERLDASFDGLWVVTLSVLGAS